MGWGHSPHHHSHVTHVNYGISLNIVHVWILQPQLFASSLCRADNSRGHCVLQRKWASQGHHELASSQVRWLSQQQYRKVSLHGVRRDGVDQSRTETISVCVQHIYDTVSSLWALVIQESPTYNLRIAHLGFTTQGRPKASSLNSSCHSHSFLVLVFCCFFFLQPHYRAYGSSQARDLIGAKAAGLCHSHGNTGSLTHWARPGIEPASSLTLCQVRNSPSHNGNSCFHFCFFFFCPIWGIWNFLGQGSTPSHSCDLYHSWGCARSLTHCTTVGTPNSQLLRWSESSPKSKIIAWEFPSWLSDSEPD